MAAVRIVSVCLWQLPNRWNWASESIVVLPADCVGNVGAAGVITVNVRNFEVISGRVKVYWTAR